MSTQIRRLKPKEYEPWVSTWMGMSADHADRLRHELTSGNRIVFLYEVDGVSVGQASLVLEKDDSDDVIAGRRAYLSRLIVQEAYRHRGIGGALVDHVCDCARGLGYAEITVGVDAQNATARRLYARRGSTTVLFEGEDERGRYLKLLRPLR